MNSPHQSELLRAFLAESDAPCPVCGYNLRGLREAACPECGDPLELALSRRAPKHGAYTCAVMPLGMAAAFSILLTVAEGVYGREDSLHGDWKDMGIYTVVAGVYGAGTLALWHAEERILRMRLPRLRELCFCVWGAAIGVAAVAVWAVRSA
jgi:hypothetical protein